MTINNPILDILEVIRNEQTYRERLEEIRAAERELTEKKHISMTMDQATRQLKEAEKTKELYIDKLAKAFKEIEAEREKKLGELVVKEKKLQEAQETAARLTKDAQMQRDAVEQEKERLRLEWIKLREFREATDAKHAEARILKDDFRSRALKIREIMDYGIKE